MGFEITVDGTLVRQKCFGGTDDDKSSNLINGNLSDYLVIGYSASTDGDVMTYDESFHLWAINFDSLFNLNWVFGFGGASDDRGYSAVLTEDSNFILTGEVFSEELPGFIGGIRDAIIIKLDTNGNLVWVNFFGGSDGESINHISHSFGENYLLIGHATSSDGDIPSNTGLNDVFVSEISSDGIVLETIVFGGSHEDIGHGIIGSSISDFVAVGDFYSDDYDFPTNYGYKDAFILKYHECTQSFYKDTDSDGFGDVLTDSVACDIPAGYVSDSTDCNDTNPDIHPFLSDICNSIDDNCNGVTDEDAIFVTYFLDNDGDLFGNELMDSISCNILIGYVENNLDCNDENPDINPLAVEICNAIDDNCNTDIDEGLTIYTFYADADGDTYGNPDAAVDTCIETIVGYVNNGLDCNDTLATIYPGATELCNYLDDDCDGLTDENLTYILSYQDNDGDDFGNPLIDSLACELPIGYVVDNTDCDDTNADIYPGAEELLNGIDDDCDQTTDEGLSINDPATNTFSLHPNPTFSTIQINAIFNEVGTYIIYASTGQLITSGVWNSGEQIISVITLAPGVYSIQLQASDTISSGFFVKL
ncbi:MAG: T9SS type A sorting domain-containing protein [Bacteroidetes bacterium]|nr:T9SS type A sorting domain-containing protein [Bacteroidota bacterium]